MAAADLLYVIATESSVLLITCSDVNSLLRMLADDCAARRCALGAL